MAGPTPVQAPVQASTPVTDTAASGVTNTTAQQQALLTALQTQQGLNNQSQVYGQLQGIANGTGPNPAQTMLNTATGTNVANQAALMAGQRGASSNPALIARQAAQTGAGIQQGAAGQAATLQANQSLNAINAAGNIANTQAANVVGQTNANAGTQLQNQGQVLQNNQALNSNLVANAGQANTVNSNNFNTAMGPVSGLIGGAAQGAGAALALADGGQVPDASAFAGASKFGQFLSSLPTATVQPTMSAPTPMTSTPNQGAAALTKKLTERFRRHISN
jgi:hypothetical protein